MKAGELREQVCEANRELGASGLVTLTWGNASGVDRAAGLVAIKPSGTPYDALKANDIVLVSLEDGIVVDGSLSPSSDTPAHLCLYQNFAGIGGVVHTHSTHATSWAQARRELPCLGTTHADHFYGTVPLARELTDEEVHSKYEWFTGISIVDRFREGKIDPLQMPAVLVPGHGPFTWGGDARKALENAIALEESARMAAMVLSLRPDAEPLPQVLLDKHFLRKHGPGAYYGQRRGPPRRS